MWVGKLRKYMLTSLFIYQFSKDCVLITCMHNASRDPQNHAGIPSSNSLAAGYSRLMSSLSSSQRLAAIRGVPRPRTCKYSAVEEYFVVHC